MTDEKQSPNLIQNKVRILVAEDNPVNQKVIRIILEREGFNFEIADNGEDVIKSYETGQFDLVLMDCQMPKMDGLQASVQIRKFEHATEKARCPIVAMTANAMTGDRERCLSHGMDDFLAKPFKRNELMAVIELWSRR